jgi:hypothetical protein
MDRVPEFWSWLVHQAGLENIKLPQEIYDELADKSTVKADRDELAVWVDHSEIRPVILLGEEPDMDHVSRVTYNGYTPNPTDADLIKIGRRSDSCLLCFKRYRQSNSCYNRRF